jgi:hypothetical protein
MKKTITALQILGNIWLTTCDVAAQVLLKEVLRVVLQHESPSPYNLRMLGCIGPTLYIFCLRYEPQRCTVILQNSGNKYISSMLTALPILLPL